MSHRFLSIALLAAVLAAFVMLPVRADQHEKGEKATGEMKPLKALIIDGQNNHNWKATTPVLQAMLEASGRFKVEVATSPARGGDMAAWSPKFADYDLVVTNYNGQMWSEQTQKAFIDYVEGGGGLVVVHAANNSFGQWEEYNKMIGLGGWGGRNEKSGPLVYIKDGELVRDDSKGRGGGHGPRHDFQMQTREKEHPIMKDLPEKWMHAKDELYHALRGPAENMTILATAYSAKDKRGTERDEPLLMTVAYGKGRVFHTALGHDVYAMNCVGFQLTTVRGAEWVATGKVTLEVPDNFPTADEVRMIETEVAITPSDDVCVHCDQH